MKEELTEIICIIDRSGSMNRIKDDTIGGFNQFLKEQKAVDGEANLTYVQFDHEYDLVHDCLDIQSIEELTEKIYIPRGQTALLDAIGRTIATVGERLSKTSEEDRPGKVVVVVLTDGLENASKEYALDQIKKMITHQEDQYNWQFVYLGANQDAIQNGGAMGFSSSINYAHTGKGVTDAYGTTSKALRSYRTSVCDSMAFETDDASKEVELTKKDKE